MAAEIIETRRETVEQKAVEIDQDQIESAIRVHYAQLLGAEPEDVTVSFHNLERWLRATVRSKRVIQE